MEKEAPVQIESQSAILCSEVTRQAFVMSSAPFGQMRNWVCAQRSWIITRRTVPSACFLHFGSPLVSIDMDFDSQADVYTFSGGGENGA